MEHLISVEFLVTTDRVIKRLDKTLQEKKQVIY